MVTQFGAGRMIKLAYICFGLSIFGLVHHWYVSGSYWNWADFWHHEPLIAMCISAGLAFVLAHIITKRR